MKKIIKTVIISGVIILLKCYAFADDFSCSNGDHNTIYIEGELHDHEECIKRKDQLKQEARDGRIILAMEGQFFNKKAGNIFGIEEFYVYNLIPIWTFYTEFALYKILQEVVALNENEPMIQTTEIIDSINADLKIPKIVLASSSEIEVKLLLMLSFFKELGRDDFDILYPKNKQILEAFEESGLFSSRRANFFYQIVQKHSSETPFFLSICKDISQWINLFKDFTNLYLQKVVKNKQISADTEKQLMIYTTQIEEYLKMDVDAQKELTSCHSS